MRRDAHLSVAKQLWEQALCTEVKPGDNFFNLGGTSLLASQVIFSLSAHFGLEPGPIYQAFYNTRSLEEFSVELGRLNHIPSSGAVATGSIPVANKRDHVRLSFEQERLWLLEQINPGTAVYHIPVVIRIRTSLDEATLQSAVEALVARHEVLRSNVEIGAAGMAYLNIATPTHLVAQTVVQTTVVQTNDLSDLKPEEQEPFLERFLAREAQQVFDLIRGPLFRMGLLRLASNDHIFYLTMHHLISDAWSVGVIVRDLAELYKARLEGRTANLPALPIQYSDYAVWQREKLQGRELERLLSYWMTELADAPTVLELPTDRPRPPVPDFRGDRLKFALDGALTSNLRGVGTEQGATLFMVVLAAFNVILSRYCAQENILVGLPIANRSAVETQNLAGFFINTLVIRTDLSEEPGFRTLLGRVRTRALEAYAHQELPLLKLVEALQPERDMSRQPLFQVMLNFADMDASQVKIPDGWDLGFGPQRTSKFDLTLYLSQSSESLLFEIEYASSLFDRPTIERFAGHFKTIMEGIARNPDQAISHLPLLTKPERAHLISAWRGSIAEYPNGLTIHDLFVQQAQRAPDTVAILQNGRTLTYRDLDRRSNQFAHYLRSLGVRMEMPVGVYLERSFEWVIAVVGIMKSGGCYVPLDLMYPKERLKYMIRQSQVLVVLTQASLRTQLAEVSSVEVIELDTNESAISRQSNSPLEQSAMPQSLAYILFTSGSTGRPKGVMVQHQGFVNYLTQMRAVFSLENGDAVLQVTSPSFDPSLRELFATLSSGAQLVLPGSNEANDPMAYLRLIREGSVSRIIGITPTMLKMIVAYAGDQDHSRSRLSAIFPSGEALEPGLCADVCKTFGPQVRITNIYGPTETTLTCCTFALAQSQSNAGAVPIGRPIANVEAWVLDRYGELLPAGVPGELCIGGIGLSRGYAQQPDLTADRFVPSPFNDGTRLYKTGDRVRWLANGLLEFLGRVDHQVKLRGYRIEPGEVESVLGEHPSVREAAVVVRQDVVGETRLVGYVVWREPATGDLRVVRNYLKHRLPEYMIPAALVVLEELPLTPSKKVDRKALPAPAAEIYSELDGSTASMYSPPRTPMEEMLAGIWKEVLHSGQIGINDDFFVLGGHSLLAMRVIAQVRNVLKIEIPLRAIFVKPRMAELAQHIEELQLTGNTVALPPLTSRPRTGPLPLSFAQERLWFLEQLGLAGTAYNVPAAFHLQGVLDVKALELSLTQLVKRHESLRTHFESAGSECRQVIETAVEFHLEVIDLSPLDTEERVREAWRRRQEEIEWRFNLERGPLFRASLQRLAPEEHVLLLTAHHIISDGWSMGLLVRELGELYAGLMEGRVVQLPELKVQYSDYAQWQREWLAGEVLEEQLGYWRDKLSGAAVLQMPTDRGRPPIPSFRGGFVSFSVSPELREGMEKLARMEGATLYMVLLAGLQVLLGRWSNQQDVVVGSPIAGRRYLETEGLIGFFVNMLALRTDLGEQPGFREVLRRVKEVMLGAYAHQDMPFEKLVAELQPQRDLSRQPLFQVAFALQNILPDELDLPGLKLRPMAGEHGTSKFDLGIVVEEAFSKLHGHIKYATDLFDENTIVRLIDHWKRLMEGAVAKPECCIWELPLLSEEERRQLLVEWNATEREDLDARHVHELFAQQAGKTPDSIALVYQDEHLSYAGLEARSNRLAGYLRAKGAGPELIVGLCVDRSVEMVVGVLGILKAEGAYLPLDPNYPDARLALMIQDARPKVILTTTELSRRMPATFQVIAFDGEELHSLLETAETRSSTDARRSFLLPQHPAYVIYTSGSTGTPKGVVITHAGIPNLIKTQVPHYAVTAKSRVLQFSSLSFDAATSEIARALLSGATLVLPTSYERSGDALAQIIQRHDITHVSLPPAVLSTIPNHTALSLETLSVAGEACSGELVARWSKGRRMLNVYGPTEITVCATFSDPLFGSQMPSIGRPISNMRVYVLNQTLEPVPVGAQGELYIAGVGLARGYLSRPDLTAERFVPNPFDPSGTRVYRTGDMVCWRPDGNLEFEGRTDRQVKIRGFRVELGEVEAILHEHPWVQQAAVVARQDLPGEKRLVGYFVWAERGVGDIAGLRSYLKERLPEYMVPAFLVALESLPLTVHGKVDQKALPAPEEQVQGMTYAPPQTPVQEMLAEIWAEALHTKHVGIHNDFFELGGHSLLTTRVIAGIREKLKIELPLRTIFENPTIAELAQRSEELQRAGEASALPPLIARPRGGPSPLSFAQERLWFLEQLDLVGAAYNMPAAFLLQGALAVEALELSLAKLVERHESLRTRFVCISSENRQVIDSAGKFRLEVIDLSQMEPEKRELETRRRRQEELEWRFDLGRGPLFRASLLRLGPEEHVLLLTMHHIISDGWSMGVLVRELGQLYRGLIEGRVEALPELKAQYADYAQWQREWLTGEVLEKQLGYWREKLSGAAVLEMPTDRVRPALPSFRGGLVSFELTREVREGLEHLGHEEGATLYMVLLAALQLLLGRWSRQQDVVLGSPIAGRRYRETEGMLGFFVNMLALRTDLGGTPGFRELLRRVKEVTLEAYAHQDIPFEKLVAELQPQRDLSRQPLFQHALVFLNMPQEYLDLPQLKMRPFHGEQVTSRFDLSVYLQVTPSGLAAGMEFAADLFDLSTIERLIEHWKRLLLRVIGESDTNIWELPLLSNEERRQLLVEWNATEKESPGERCLHEIFAEQAGRTPDVIAVAYGEEQISYSELEAKSNQLGHYLREKGVRPDVVVGLCVERSVEMIVGLMGILKAGGAYLPLDPGYPPERLRYMLEDGQSPVLITQKNMAEHLQEYRGEVICIDHDSHQIGRRSAESLAAGAQSGNLAYVIYTSGSTGTPKGVGVHHRGVSNAIAAAIGAVAPRPGDRNLQWASLSFDASMFDIGIALLSGVTLCLGTRDSMLPGESLSAFLKAMAISTLAITPSSLHHLPVAELPHLRTIVVLGEQCPADLVLRWGSGRRIFNAYGPTETSMWIAGTFLDGSRKPPIGKPIANTKIYLLDSTLEPVPIGVAGELYVSGSGLGRGYLKNPDLTANSFIPDPFSHHPGTRMYRTGDLGRYLPDGTIEFLGRTDDQVKLRGYRVEPGEIAAVLRQFPPVAEAVVLARELSPGELALIAYVVLHPDQTAAADELRDFLKSKLPDHMIPSSFVLLEEFPLNSSGKLDAHKLPTPDRMHLLTSRDYVPPCNPVEALIAGIWTSVLHIKPIGIHDDFFELGGHSLLATQMITRVRTELGIEVPLRMVFQAPVLADFAAQIQRLRLISEHSLGAVHAGAEFEEGVV
jgi:amino acid adenylation domain-containing protein